MFKRKTMLALYLFVFVAFTNISAYTVEKFNIPLIPILFIAATGMLFFEIITAKTSTLPNYRNSATYAINFFLLTYLTLSSINADTTKAIFPDIYLLLTGLLMFHLFLWCIQREEELEGILLVILLSGPLLALNGAYQFLGDISTAAFDYRVRAAGWWGNPNEYALVLNLIYLVTFYFIDKEQKVLRMMGYLGQLSTAAGIFLSMSRAGLVIFGLTSLLGWRTFWRHKAYLAFLIIVVPMVYMLVSFNFLNIDFIQDHHLDRALSTSAGRINPLSEENAGDYSNGRIAAAITGLKIYARHPLLGVGLGNMADYAAIVNHTRLLSHNLFVEILATGGPLPLICYVFMLWCLWSSFPKSMGINTNMGKVFRWFIIILPVMSIFSHSLIYMKPVMVILSLLPIYYQITSNKKLNL